MKIKIKVVDFHFNDLVIKNFILILILNKISL